MIESFMYFGIGFLLAVLSLFVVAPLVHCRAVRLTARRLKSAIPSSIVEVVAEKDSLRAEFAMATRRLETNLQQLKAKSASQLAELGRKDDAINRLKIELGELRAQMRAAEEDLAVKAAAPHEAQHVLSEKEAILVKRRRDLDQRATLTDAQRIEIIALKTQVEVLKAQLSAPHELKAVDRTDAAVHEAPRDVSEKEAELAEQIRELNQRSTLSDAQKLDIITLKDEVKALEQQMDEATHELKAVEDGSDAALHEAQRAMSEKEAELAEQVRELNQRSILADAQKLEITTLKDEVKALEQQLDEATHELKAVEDRSDAALHEDQSALSEKEAELAEQVRELNQRSTLADAQKLEITTLKDEVKALEQQLDEATHELKAVEDRRDAALHEAQRAMSEKEAELAEQVRELNQRSTLADAQKLEIITLKTQVETLEQQLDEATHELKAVEDRRDAALHEAERAVSEKKADLAGWMRELDEWSTFADAQKIEIVALEIQVEALKEQLDRANVMN